MRPLEADQEGVREVIRACEIIGRAVKENQLSIMYVMEAFQFLYASTASRLVSYADYCQRMEYLKNDYKELWQNNPWRL